jgi:hypothetical protein
MISTIARRCYQMVTITTDEYVMSLTPLLLRATTATGGTVTSPRSHYRNGSQTTEAFCSSVVKLRVISHKKIYSDIIVIIFV